MDNFNIWVPVIIVVSFIVLIAYLLANRASEKVFFMGKRMGLWESRKDITFYKVDGLLCVEWYKTWPKSGKKTYKSAFAHEIKAMHNKFVSKISITDANELGIVRDKVKL